MVSKVIGFELTPSPLQSAVTSSRRYQETYGSVIELRVLEARPRVGVVPAWRFNFELIQKLEESFAIHWSVHRLLFVVSAPFPSSHAQRTTDNRQHTIFSISTAIPRDSQGPGKKDYWNNRAKLTGFSSTTIYAAFA